MINQQIFTNFNNKSSSKIKETSKIILSSLIEPFSNYLEQLKTSTRGRKRVIRLADFFKAFYAVTRNAVATSDLYDYFIIIPDNDLSKDI